MSCVYILYSQKTKKYYTGSSRERTSKSRLQSHNAGRTISTKHGAPWTVVYEEECEDYTQARKREFFLKSGVGRKWIREKFLKPL